MSDQYTKDYQRFMRAGLGPVEAVKRAKEEEQKSRDFFSGFQEGTLNMTRRAKKND